MVDEYGGEEDAEGEHETAEPHHHPGDRPHVNHREVGVLNRHQRFRRGGCMVNNYCSDHQVVSHVEEQAWATCCKVVAPPGAGGALAYLGFAFLTWECHCHWAGTGEPVIPVYTPILLH